jgi:hypothetical protein
MYKQKAGVRMSRQKVIYQEKYKKGAGKINDRKLPDLNHLNEGFYCCAAEVTSAGVIEVDGVRYEFNDMRVLIRERGKP